MRRPTVPRGLHPFLAPVAFVLSTTASDIYTPTRSNLLIIGITWGLLAGYLAWLTGLRKRSKGSSNAAQTATIAGAAFAVAHIYARLESDRDASRWTRAALPLLIAALAHSGLGEAQPSYGSIQTDKSSETESGTLKKLLVIVTGTGAAALAYGYTRPAAVALGVCSTALFALSLVLLKKALEGVSRDEGFAVTGAAEKKRICLYFKAQTPKSHHLVFRDMALVVSVCCIGASLFIEGPHISPLATHPTLNDLLHSTDTVWTTWLWLDRVDHILIGITLETIKASTLFVLLSKFNVLHTSLLSIGGVVLAHLLTSFGIWELSFTSLYTVAASTIARLPRAGQLPSSPRLGSAHSKTWERSRQIAAVLTVVSVILTTIRFGPFSWASDITSMTVSFPSENPLSALGPLRPPDQKTHPITQLTQNAQKSFEALKSRQSKSLEEAVKEYRRRYGIPPPPKFDVWYEFARKRNVQLIDEFDTIHDTLTPFWGLDPLQLRQRVAEALGFENNLVGILVRNGHIEYVSGANSSSVEWLKDATVHMLDPFVEHLPDMDLAFNLHDEPRVIIPNDILSKLVQTARTKAQPESSKLLEHTNSFSPRPADMMAKTIEDVRTSRFNRFAHQNTWAHSRASCSPDSPSRDPTDSYRDNVTAHAFGELGFIYNTTAFSDICQMPSLHNTFGFFDRPNAFNVVQDLVPIFSQSKLSSFQDILYPSPWYYTDRVPYHEKEDKDWSKKNASTYWRGSTTGGFSRSGGWRRQHRQRVVRILNSRERATILAQPTPNSDWQPRTVDRRAYAGLFNVSFSHVGQCDVADCRAQREFFHISKETTQENAWQSKLLLDIDGNAFSGRFLAFLRSRSLVMKIAFFREWHAEWLMPWVHYVPLSLRGDEWLEAVRMFAGGKDADKNGEQMGKRIADEGREWAKQSMRKEDMEAWFFRLMLEYGRLVDDKRSKIGFTGH